jgi:hypothetical protein
VQVIHVFPETDQDAREAHMEFWFGYPTDPIGWDHNDRAVVCFCGGTLFPLQRDATGVLVAGVWHREHWYDAAPPVLEWPDDGDGE